jgi:hypothetical protein
MKDVWKTELLLHSGFAKTILRAQTGGYEAEILEEIVVNHNF